MSGLLLHLLSEVAVATSFAARMNVSFTSHLHLSSPDLMSRSDAASDPLFPLRRIPHAGCMRTPLRMLQFLAATQASQ
jgi:hypothetical protein